MDFNAAAAAVFDLDVALSTAMCIPCLRILKASFFAS
jgi:hypothetical protein